MKDRKWEKNRNQWEFEHSGNQSIGEIVFLLEQVHKWSNETEKKEVEPQS